MIMFLEKCANSNKGISCNLGWKECKDGCADRMVKKELAEVKSN